MAKLLIVDDDPFITESLKVGLGSRGHEVFAGHNGKEGVDLVDELTPDLVIIDMTMPIMDGLARDLLKFKSCWFVTGKLE